MNAWTRLTRPGCSRASRSTSNRTILYMSVKWEPYEFLDAFPRAGHCGPWGSARGCERKCASSSVSRSRRSDDTRPRLPTPSPIARRTPTTHGPRAWTVKKSTA